MKTDTITVAEPLFMRPRFTATDLHRKIRKHLPAADFYSPDVLRITATVVAGGQVYDAGFTYALRSELPTGRPSLLIWVPLDYSLEPSQKPLPPRPEREPAEPEIFTKARLQAICIDPQLWAQIHFGGRNCPCTPELLPARPYEHMSEAALEQARTTAEHLEQYQVCAAINEEILNRVTFEW